ncbi:MAG: hypothetical protein GX128_02040 [Bacteroidales bacterium]|jgi:hypothetical protein|nr:hypothetical protein [Bacteroidales bacterium]
MRIILILIAIVVSLISCGDSKKEEALYNQINELELKLDYYRNGVERIYTNINNCIDQEQTEQAKELIHELEENFSYCNIFHKIDSIKNIIRLIELRNFEAHPIRAEKEEIKVEEKTRIDEEEQKTFAKSLFLKVYAQAYSDGYLSCNIFLADLKGNTYSMIGGELDYKVYDITGSIIKTYANSNITTVGDAIYIDIPLGISALSRARFVEFEYINYKGETFKSSKTAIE